jgi:formate-nitrite transporter family protein
LSAFLLDKNLKAEEQEKEIYRRTAPPGQVVYQAIYEEADHELGRDTPALAWSGVAAGLSMGFSMIAEAMLITHVPHARWSPMLTKLGYTVGFLIVILGRQQLFTENTLTPVLPLLRKPSGSMLLNVGRLWAVVLLTNLAGGFILAWAAAHTALLSAEMRQACHDIGQEALQLPFLTVLLRAIVAGWLIATMVWLLPFAETARVWVIIIVSYLVGLGQFPHVIAGGVSNLYLVASGEISLGRSLGSYLVPVVLGNCVGGVALVAALAHAQFMAAGRGDDGNAG